MYIACYLHNYLQGVNYKNINCENKSLSFCYNLNLSFGYETSDDTYEKQNKIKIQVKLNLMINCTHDEANRLAFICNKLNKVNWLLEPKVKSLEEELHKAKTDLVSLELTYLHASIKTCKIVRSWKNKLNICLKPYQISPKVEKKGLIMVYNTDSFVLTLMSKMVLLSINIGT